MSLITNYWDIFRSDKLREKFEEIDNTIFVKEVEVTAAQLIAMNGAAVEVIPAAGSGKVLELIDAVFIFDYGTTQFTGGGAVVLQEETSATALSGTVASTVIKAAADSITKVLGVAATLTANKGVFISNATAAFADGDSVLRLKVAYRVHSTGL